MSRHCPTCGHRLRVKTPAVPREVVVDAYATYRGVPRDVIAGRLGMRRVAFDRALFRARDAGDPRAADFGRRAA